MGRVALTDNTTLTRALLTCGVAAGPIYIIVGVIEILIRPGFDPTRHDLSLMSNGDLGWIHITLLVLTGLLTIAGAVGMRRVLLEGKARTWGPLLLALYGLGLVGAGIFIADPMGGFPPGTPANANTITGHGLMHFVSGAVGFIGLIAACFVFARRFSSLKERGWAQYSLATGTLFLAAFFGIAMGSQQKGFILTFVILAFTAAVILGWTWISLLSEKLKKEIV